MAVEAPYSKFKLQNLMIYMAICVGMSVWFVYDGYFNETFIEKHTKVDEVAGEYPDKTLVAHQKGPFILMAMAAGLAVRWAMVRKFKITSDDANVVFGSRTIKLDSIEKIDKTYFASKGHFTIFYKDAKEGECKLKLSNKVYDGLDVLLDHIVAKMTS